MVVKSKQEIIRVHLKAIPKIGRVESRPGKVRDKNGHDFIKYKQMKEKRNENQNCCRTAALFAVPVRGQHVQVDTIDIESVPGSGMGARVGELWMSGDENPKREYPDKACACGGFTTLCPTLK
jgi:hypothetical protein